MGPRREITTIQISKETRELLKQIGRKGETYDQIIRRLIKQVYGEEALNVENPHRKSSPADEVGSVEEG
jgi:hypothetical protein